MGPAQRGEGGGGVRVGGGGLCVGGMPADEGVCRLVYQLCASPGPDVTGIAGGWGEEAGVVQGPPACPSLCKRAVTKACTRLGMFSPKTYTSKRSVRRGGL